MGLARIIDEPENSIVITIDTPIKLIRIRRLQW